MNEWIENYVPKRTKKSFLWLFTCFREYLETTPVLDDFNDISCIKLLWVLLELYLECDKNERM